MEHSKRKQQLSREEILATHHIPEGAKIFIFDTSALMQNYGILDFCGDNIKVIPLVVLEELDRHKNREDEQGRNVRSAVRYLNKLRAQGSLRKGQIDGAGGIVFVDYNNNDFDKLPEGIERSEDAKIILVGVEWQEAFPERVVEAISEDLLFQLIADACGLDCYGFKKGQVKVEESYSGIKSISVDGELINCLYEDGIVPADIFLGDYKATANECFVFKDQSNGKQSVLAKFLDDDLILVQRENCYFGKLRPRNLRQIFSLNLLMDDSISCVTVTGKAGTGKTISALMAGLKKMEEGRYEKMLICKPVIPLGKDIGYLPGDKDKKMSEWMGSVFDNLDYIFSFSPFVDKKTGAKIATTKDFLNSGLLELASISHIRGRSIPYCYIIVEEAQNMTRHEIKTLLTRAGEGTKVALTGDVEQIDSLFLDESNNGLSVLVERVKEELVTGHITLEKGERSELATMASKLL